MLISNIFFFIYFLFLIRNNKIKLMNLKILNFANIFFFSKFLSFLYVFAQIFLANFACFFQHTLSIGNFFFFFFFVIFSSLSLWLINVKDFLIKQKKCFFYKPFWCEFEYNIVQNRQGVVNSELKG